MARILLVAELLDATLDGGADDESVLQALSRA